MWPARILTLQEKKTMNGNPTHPVRINERKKDHVVEDGGWKEEGKGKAVVLPNVGEYEEGGRVEFKLLQCGHVH